MTTQYEYTVTLNSVQSETLEGWLERRHINYKKKPVPEPIPTKRSAMIEIKGARYVKTTAEVSPEAYWIGINSGNTLIHRGIQELADRNGYRVIYEGES